MNRNILGLIILSLILFFAAVVSLSHLTTQPRVWFDEGLNLEISRNFLLFHKLDIMVAPNVFSGVPYAAGTNGYPLTILLAGIFYVFGFGLVQARLFMLFWMLLALVAVYVVSKKIFGAGKALLAAAFVASFAPFYGNGLAVFGEVPGFVFLLWGLFFLLRPEKKNYWLAGLFFSLAAVTKPSLYLLLFPSFLLFAILEDRKKIFRKILKFAAPALPPILLWIVLAFPNPFSAKTWQAALDFYGYPFGGEFSVLANLPSNIRLIFTHSTLIYFLLITFVVIFWFYARGRREPAARKWGVFFFIYGLFALLYFLKSPGWLRYLFGFEIMAFIFLPAGLEALAQKFFKKENLSRMIFGGAIGLLLVIQLIQLFFFRADPYSPHPQRVASFLKERLAKDENCRAGFINSPEIAGLIGPLKKFSLVKVGGPLPALGQNPLSFPKDSLPCFIVFEKWNKFVEGYKNVLEENYILIKKFGGFSVYELK